MLDAFGDAFDDNLEEPVVARLQVVHHDVALLNSVLGRSLPRGVLLPQV